MNPREAQRKGQNDLHSSNSKTFLKLSNKRRKLQSQLDTLQKKNQYTLKRRENLNPIEAEKAKGLKSEIRKLTSELNKLEVSNARIVGDRNKYEDRVQTPRGMNKGGYAKCGASNPPSKKR